MMTGAGAQHVNLGGALVPDLGEFEHARLQAMRMRPGQWSYWERLPFPTGPEQNRLRWCRGRRPRAAATWC